MAKGAKTAVAVLSGGLDSSVATHLAQLEGWKIVLALSFNYGQRAARRELSAAAKICAHLKIRHRVIVLPWFKEFRCGGLLSEKSRLPQPKPKELEDPKFTQASAKAVWVPNRNGVFIEIAAGFAEDAGAQAVIVGFNKEEAATFPDNSVPYLKAISKSLSYSTATGVFLICPTAHLSKNQIVKRALENRFPLNLVWSCYQSKAKMCGKCESCQRLMRALSKNEISYESLFENKL